MTKTVTQAVEELIRATIWRSDEDMGRPWAWGNYDAENGKGDELRVSLATTISERAAQVGD